MSPYKHTHIAVRIYSTCKNICANINIVNCIMKIQSVID